MNDKPPTDVVTAFVTKDDKVLLLKRSQQVGTYRGLWAGVSGYLESDDPQAQVLRELSEELGLAPNDVRLEAMGKPILVRDGDSAWLVHPFRYEVSPHAALVLDWEHVAFQFVNPYEMETMETVPGLFDAWLRVANESDRDTNSSLAPEFEKIIGEIATDRENGATKLAGRALDALERLATSGVISNNPQDAVLEVASAARRLSELRHGMGAIGVQAVLAVSRARDLMRQGMAPAAAIARAASDERKTLGESTGIISTMLLRLLGPGGAFVTCSWSMTAMRALVALKADKVFIGDGHDLQDGLRAATWLAARDIKVEVVPDGALPLKVSSARAVIVGADQILGDGSLVNRSGTFPLALTAQYFELPFYVVCQRIKLSGLMPPKNEEAPLREYPIPSGVSYRSPLFDVTPSGLLSGIVTESGVLTPGEAAEIGASMARLRDSLFQNI